MRVDVQNTEAQIDRCVRLGLLCIPREYPHAAQGMQLSEADVRTPSQHWPVFFGCYDWHSAVHNHWQLVRALRVRPQAAWASEVAELLVLQLQPSALAQEAAFLRRFTTFEMPYGVAWLHLLCAEVHALAQASSPWAKVAARWEQALAALHEVACANTLAYWRSLVVPNRAGAHANTAFAAGLMLDAARMQTTSHAVATESEIASYFERHVRWSERMSARCEPLGYDFLSPTLCEADLARRLLPASEFAVWLGEACGDINELRPPKPVRPEDGQQSHFDGLNISRAWMLANIADALPDGDERVASLHELAQLHASEGLAGDSHQHYSGQHWLGSFAMYLLTRPACAGSV